MTSVYDDGRLHVHFYCVRTVAFPIPFDPICVCNCDTVLYHLSVMCIHISFDSYGVRARAMTMTSGYRRMESVCARDCTSHSATHVVPLIKIQMDETTKMA